MKNLKCFMLAACLLCASVSVNSAALNYSSELNLGTLSAGLNQSVNPVNGSCLDRIQFAMAVEINGSVELDAPDFKFGAISMLNINRLALSIFDSNDTLLGHYDNEAIDFSPPGMPAGEHSLLVNGLADGISGGMYVLAIHVFPVPEANVLNMFMAGLTTHDLTTIGWRHQ